MFEMDISRCFGTLCKFMELSIPAVVCAVTLLTGCQFTNVSPTRAVAQLESSSKTGLIIGAVEFVEGSSGVVANGFVTGLPVGAYQLFLQDAPGCEGQTTNTLMNISVDNDEEFSRGDGYVADASLSKGRTKLSQQAVAVLSNTGAVVACGPVRLVQ